MGRWIGAASVLLVAGGIAAAGLRGGYLWALLLVGLLLLVPLLAGASLRSDDRGSKEEEGVGSEGAGVRGGIERRSRAGWWVGGFRERLQTGGNDATRPPGGGSR
ncbi:MAG TPA: hypothetical protein VF058_07510 [Actinomycetota bacterium]